MKTTKKQEFEADYNKIYNDLYGISYSAYGITIEGVRIPIFINNGIAYVKRTYCYVSQGTTIQTLDGIVKKIPFGSVEVESHNIQTTCCSGVQVMTKQEKKRNKFIKKLTRLSLKYNIAICGMTHSGGPSLVTIKDEIEIAQQLYFNEHTKEYEVKIND